MDIGSNVISFLVGVATTYLIAYLQFRSSVAGNRVRWVADATREITKRLKSTDTSTSGLRDKYRKSLGVIIDELAQGYDCNAPFPEEGSWPLLSDGNGDRWYQFNEYVQPVIDQITVYTFMSYWLPGHNLRGLSKLCKQLELVFGALDAAFEVKVIEVKDVNGKKGIYPLSEKTGTPAIHELRQAYKELFRIWCNWLKQTAKSSS